MWQFNNKIKMEKEQLILQVSEMLNLGCDTTKQRCIELIEDLAKIGCEHDKGSVWSAFEAFLNHETKNFLSDETFDKIKVENFKWSKEKIKNWLNEQGKPLSVEGEYNFNALVLAMNYEYASHSKYIEKVGNQAMTTYMLAKEALEHEGYIERVLSLYLPETY